ncbi:MAG TPA: YebC/PmpR family DNA-binding transcriptional regulator [Patescibacteria group bacterium]|nr:YebC/PmpR family DNA-binding transcriptional regulator [Patescibacteria group bacterium]
MSGHSKWATIHRQKEATDQKRGQAFTKIANAITLAVRDGGGITDPEHNFRLRLAIERARAVNMPKDNIQRAIDRVGGKGEEAALMEATYEGYAPGGVGVLVEVTTDNKQRTVQEVKNIFDRNGGSLTSPGAVVYNFQKVGSLIVNVSGNKEEAILKIIDLGVDDVEEAGDNNLEIHVSPENLMATKEKLAAANLQPTSVEIEMKPVNLVAIADQKTAQQVLGLLEKLESLDDVQRVYANFDIPDEFLPEPAAA